MEQLADVATQLSKLTCQSDNRLGAQTQWNSPRYLACHDRADVSPGQLTHA